MNGPTGVTQEAANRRHGALISTEEHFRLRHDTIGVQPTLDLAERIGYDELPTALFAPNAVSALRAEAAEIDSLHKDVYSPARGSKLGHAQPPADPPTRPRIRPPHRLRMALGMLHALIVSSARSEAVDHMSEAWRQHSIDTDSGMNVGAAYPSDQANAAGSRCIQAMRRNL
ncbi:terpene synthase family protein [Streptomyces erythrochromogenes]|uniref:Terpene synthase family protein n=1 Tax=Streptomyces erythrochromogenes TaxID=285574 RepID=A0ABZ1Q5G7_9ACTN|nr:terpene synthase family protein [Streptomyces erythrochromogenes]MCX5583206.1 terpene synthase family protein [Streptomyces erythrochromogenes]